MGSAELGRVQAQLSTQTREIEQVMAAVKQIKEALGSRRNAEDEQQEDEEQIALDRPRETS